jgi:hypothetical protein
VLAKSKIRPQTWITPAPFTGNDALQYTRITTALIEILKKNQNYEEIIDEILVDQLTRAYIQLRNADSFLSQGKPTEDTYTSIADAKTKLSKIMNENINQLGVSRRNRLHNEPQADIMNQIKETIESMKKWSGTN